MTGAGGLARQKLRLRARMAMRLLCAGVFLAALSPLYVWFALNCSGRLALCQTAPASGMLRGFDFGPLYIEAGQPSRYYISMQIPSGATDSWQTRFEVLDSARRPVFREDEARFIGSNQFTPGGTARASRSFTLNKASGYYYFRLSSPDAQYGSGQALTPVASLAVRQGVLSGLPFWLPPGLLLLAGVGCLWYFASLVRTLGKAQPEQARQFERLTGYPGRAVKSG